MKWTFTLIELFVVMVIVVIMLSILTPLFERMGAGNRVNSTARSIGSELSLARQYSQGNSSNVALIMPGTGMTYPSTAPAGCPTTLPAEFKFRIYRLAYVDSSFNFSSWVEGSKWSFLPKGCAIMEADDDIGIQNSGLYVIQPNDDTTSTVDNVPFGPPLVDGVCGLLGDDVRAVVYGPTGKLTPTGTFRNITIGEAEWNESLGNFTIKNAMPVGEMTTNESSANQLTIEINGFTGGVSYVSPENYGE